jgi:uncharacterized protein YqeY
MAELKSQLENDLKAALLGGDRFKADVLRNFKAVILNEEVATGARDQGLDDETIEKLLAREVKKRGESAELYDQAGRPELAENERNEAEVLSAYLPVQLSEAEIKKVVADKIAELGASGPQAMGQVIGAVKKDVGNSADGALVAKLVREALQ